MPHSPSASVSFAVKPLLWLGVVCSLVACQTASGAEVTTQLAGEGPSYVKGEFVVQFKDTLTRSSVGLLKQRGLNKQALVFKTALTDGAESIDRLNIDFGVTSARSLFLNREGLTTAEAQAQQRQRLTRQAISASSVPDLTNIYVFTVADPAADIEAICQEYMERGAPHVAFCQPNYLMETSWTPDDPSYHARGSWGQPYDDLWGLKAIHAAEAWERAQGEGVVVAVVDTGVDYRHPDLIDNIWTNPGEIAGNGLDDEGNGFIDDVHGFDFANSVDVNDDGDYTDPEDRQDPDPMDDDGHGTHVAGTIAATGNNRIGIIGVAPKAKVMAVKGLGGQNGSITALSAGIVYAALNGARVINNSWGSPGRLPSEPLG